MTNTSKVILATAVAAGAITAAYFLIRLADDQNPIRVKNKQLRIETEDKNARWSKDDPSVEKWKLGVSNTSATEYAVSAYGADPATTCVSPMKGNQVDIQYKLPAVTEPQTFTFRLVPLGSSNNKQPELEASTPMTAENDGPKVKKLRRTTENVIGAITSLTVSGGPTTSTCTFPADRLVAVELCMHNCS